MWRFPSKIPEIQKFNDMDTNADLLQVARAFQAYAERKRGKGEMLPSGTAPSINGRALEKSLAISRAIFQA